MPELWFYHLERENAFTLLPQLLRRGLNQGLRLCVETTTFELARHWSDHLWAHEDTGFLPHGLEGDKRSTGQPIMLTDGNANPNGSTFRFFVDGAIPSAGWLKNEAAIARASVLFEASDESSIQAARSLWREARAAGLIVRYQRQDDSGAWREVPASAT